MTGGLIPWDHTTTDTGMRVSVPIRLREIVSGAYLAYHAVSVHNELMVVSEDLVLYLRSSHQQKAHDSKF